MSSRHRYFQRALGLVYFHFGLLKFFEDLSPAEVLASETLHRLSWSLLEARSSLTFLGIVEVGLGVALFFDLFRKWTFYAFVAHMLGTFIPLFLLPEFAFKIAPFAPSFEGQYILKNLAILTAGWALLKPNIHQSRKDES